MGKAARIGQVEAYGYERRSSGNTQYPGLDPAYNDFADKYGVGNALIRKQRDQKMESYGGVDAFGPITANYNPPGEIAGDVQLQHDVAVQRYNAQLAQQAQGYLRSGLDLLQSYRPGGAASLASGQYGQLAQATLAGRVDPLDLMHEDRLDQARKARSRQRKAGQIQAGATVVGAALGAFGGPVGAAVGGAAAGYAANALYGSGEAGRGAADTNAQLSDEEGAFTDGGGGAGDVLGTDTGTDQAVSTDLGGGSGGFGSPSAMDAYGGGGTTMQSKLDTGGPSATSTGGAASQPSGGGAGGGKAASQPSGPTGALTPSGLGAMGLTNQAVADTFESRYGEPTDVMWSNYSSQAMIGFADSMLARQQA